MKTKLKLILIIILVSFVVYKYTPLGSFNELTDTSKNMSKTVTFNGSLKIAVVIPFDKDYSIYKTSLEKGLEAATQNINDQGGIINTKVSYDFIDFHKIKTLTKNNSLATYDIFLLFGRDTTISYAISDLLFLQKPLLYIQDGKCKTITDIDGKTPSKFVFGLGLTWEQMNEHFILHTLNKIKNYSKELGVIIFGNDTKDDLELFDNVINTYKNLGVKILDEKYIDPRIIDFYTEIQRIIFLKSDFVFFNATTSNGIEYIKQIAKQHISDISIISSIENLSEEITSELPTETDGLYTLSHYNSTINSPENLVFIDAIKKQNPDIPLITTTMESAYSFLYFIKSSYERARTTETNKVLQEMENIKMNLPRGAVEMNKANHILSEPLFIMKVKDGKHIIEDRVEYAKHPDVTNCEIYYEEKPKNLYD